jgi:hypothetical protein
MTADARAQAFLDLPDLAMTVADACMRFDVGEEACGAVLDLLADAKVLTKQPDGSYVRLVRERGSLRSVPAPRPNVVTAARPNVVTLPRSVAFITRDELALLAYQSRRVA